jgi:hypothetical protein
MKHADEIDVQRVLRMVQELRALPLPGEREVRENLEMPERGRD